jgi:hypothetical protein
MATTYLSPLGNEQQNDANGAPLSGGKIFTYAAGTLNPIATYMDNAGAVTQANPIVLNTSGLPANPIWLPAGQAVKMVFQDVNGVALRTVDNIVGINDPSGASTADQWVIYQGAPTFISSTSFSVAGDQRNTFQIGRRVRTANSGGTVYGYVSGCAFSSVTTVTVNLDSGSLDSGLSQASYGLLSVTNPAVPGLYGTDGTLSFRNRLHNGDFPGQPARRLWHGDAGRWGLRARPLESRRGRLQLHLCHGGQLHSHHDHRWLAAAGDRGQERRGRRLRAVEPWHCAGADCSQRSGNLRQLRHGEQHRSTVVG